MNLLYEQGFVYKSWDTGDKRKMVVKKEKISWAGCAMCVLNDCVIA